MKRYVIHTAILFLCGLLLFACRTHRHELHSSEVLQAGNVVEQQAMQSHTSVQQQQSQTSKSETANWRITFHYDTSKPPEPSTGRPPLQCVSVEGSEAMHTTNKVLQMQAERMDSTQTKKDVKSLRKESVEEQTATKVQAGIDVHKALEGGIILMLLILIVYILKSKIHA